MRKMNLFVMTCVIGSVAFAFGATPGYKDANVDTTRINACFSEFKKAFNNREIEKVKNMTGKSARRWTRWMDGDDKIDRIEIVDLSFGSTTNVLAKVSVLGANKGQRNFDARFVIATKTDGTYVIENMSLPESDLRNSLFEDSVKTSKALIKAINDRDISRVKELIACGRDANIEKELHERGLVWIKEAIDSGIKISGDRMSVQRNGGIIVGRLSVPSMAGGTNVVRQISFKGAKIERDVPIVDLAAERRKRVEKLQSDAILMREKLQREINQ